MFASRTGVAVLLAAGAGILQAPQARAQPRPPEPAAAQAAVPTQRSPLPGVQQPTAPQILPPRATAAPPENSDDRTPVTLTAISFEGVTVYGQAVLDGLLGPVHPGQAVLGDVLTAVRRLQYRYRTDGYILTKVSGKLVPQPGGYALQVQVIEGFVGAVKLAGDVGPVGNLVYRYLSALLTERPLTERGLERAVLLCEDIPGITIRTILRPSREEPGAVTLVAQISRKRLDAYASVDNRGARATGPEEIVLEGAFNSATALGDRTEVVLYNTPFDREEIFGQASETVLLGRGGLKLRGYVSYGELVPGDTLQALDYRSRILLAGVSLEYPIIRTRALSSSASLAVDFTHTDVDTNVSAPVSQRLSKENLRVLRLDSHSLVQDSLLGAALLAANDIDVQLGRGIPGLFDGTPDGFAPAARLGEKRDFFKATVSLSRSQFLYGWGRDSLDFYLALAGQWSDSVLPPSEKFFLGGTQFGRGFYSGELSGDRALAGTVELQWNAPRTLPYLWHAPVDLQFYAFYDGGQVWDRATPDVPVNLDRHLDSLGIGIRSTIAARYFVQLEGVERLTRRPQDTGRSEEKGEAFFFRVGAKF